MKILFLVLALGLSNKSFADSISSEVSAIMNLRQEVEVLSLEVESLKKTQQAQMDVYIQREQEIAAQLLKERFKTDQLKTQINVSKEKIGNSPNKIKSNNRDEWIQVFWRGYDLSISKAHPFYGQKLKERLEKIKLDYAQKKISNEHALLQTWYILDEDLKKSQEAEFILAPLTINQKLHHVEIVRLGRSKGYFRTAEGLYGQMSYSKGWDYKFFEDKSSKSMIETLIAQFKQQQKTGLYSLPGIIL